MKCKSACIVINPRDGQNVTRITALVAVLSAAGWRTEIVVKEYGGRSMELAAKAAEEEYDLVIGYGGDGTLNQVLNGVMNVKGHRSIVGVIPGGTANVWAAEVGVPNDPVQAALTLVNSEARKVDIGYVDVQGLAFPGITQDDREKKIRKRKVKAASKAQHHFLLMAGLGMDAAIMEHVSKALKHRIGPLAVGLSVAKELPRQHPFPIEIRVGGDINEGDAVWKGEAFQVVIGNTRRYANILELTPQAFLDDGMLDVCVIKAGNPLTSIEQITSFLFRRKPDTLTTEHFHGASITLSVPASIDMQLDGSAVRLKDYLSKSDRQALQRAGNAEQVMVKYAFEAMPHALQVAIPYTYDGTLFEHLSADEKPSAAAQQPEDEDTAQSRDQRFAEVQREPPELIHTLLEQGHKVTVMGVASQPEKQHEYIIAGTMQKQSTGDTSPVAIQVTGNVTILKHTGEHVAPGTLQELQEGAVVVAEGKKRKYGVIRARSVVI